MSNAETVDCNALNAEGKLVLRGAKIVKAEGNSLTVTSTQAKDVRAGKVNKIAKASVTEGRQEAALR